MAPKYLSQVRQAIEHLNPLEVRQTAERPLKIGLAAPAGGPGHALIIEDFLAPRGVSTGKRWELTETLYRIGDPGAPPEFDLEIYAQGMPRPPGAFWFSPDATEQMIEEILEAREDLGLALARLFPPFRKPVVDRVVQQIAIENALFAVVTAVPDVVPNLLELPWAVGQFASDTAFLTMNQIRMAFLLAAASDRPVGYRNQRGEIASIIAAAFGWRALARELVGKIPFGGGLIPKAAIAWAGTYVVGLSLEHLYRVGYGLSRAERRLAYKQAFPRGQAVAAALIEGLKPDAADKDS